MGAEAPLLPPCHSFSPSGSARLAAAGSLSPATVGETRAPSSSQVDTKRRYDEHTRADWPAAMRLGSDTHTHTDATGTGTHTDTSMSRAHIPIPVCHGHTYRYQYVKGTHTDASMPRAHILISVCHRHTYEYQYMPRAHTH